LHYEEVRTALARELLPAADRSALATHFAGLVDEIQIDENAISSGSRSSC